jgi:hypothetical protein
LDIEMITTVVPIVLGTGLGLLGVAVQHLQEQQEEGSQSSSSDKPEEKADQAQQ